MGKGGGCVPSKKKHPTSAEDAAGTSSTTAPITADEETHATPTVTESSENAQSVAATLKVFIVFYSMYGHVEKLAKRMKKGVEGVEGVEAVLYRVPETLPDEVLEHMKAPPKAPEVPEIKAEELAVADAILFGFPTRYGCMAAQMKAFFDSTGQLWKEQTLVGKPAGFFVSTGTQGGGQETTAWTAITQLAHHGMLFVPIGYTFGDDMSNIDFIHGGSPYGAGVYAGDGTREPIEIELALAEHQGKYMAGVAKRLSQG
ncbi:putative NAD(P)H dehydrogenase (quinone) FQR1-like 2 [Gossypium australe]|uniref:NAD(P)H dehydrogenase (quinone) n=1 Tax=Gossypium australe TaxID=47621 RepID=A0A5B6UV74_9ROSI|nr:putative NAD(P)H dehydrogenase (quinone) FQR1-like 2 [Gossypium australe]